MGCVKGQKNRRGRKKLAQRGERGEAGSETGIAVGWEGE